MRKLASFILLLLFANVQPSASAPAPIGMEKAADQAHDDVVAGTVLDTNGDPLAGVTIQQRGTQNKTVTDIEGRYTIRLKAGAARTLTFSYVGMTTQTLAAKGSMLRVVMKEDAHSLQDIVVVGAYGTAQKRSDLVGSAYQVNADQLKGLPQQRLDVMLDGLIPGVKIDPNTNDPGSPRTRYEVRVRGEASLTASNEPLWVIDGTPMYTGDKTNQMPGTSYTVSPLSFINPDDIASITVLKDATATSIYGADGANGVILVTTKRGRPGKMRVSVNTQYGIAHIDESTAPKVMNAQQWLTAAQAAYANAGLDMRTFPYQDNELNQYSTTDTDWRDVFYGTGTTFLTNVAVNGGSQKADYYVSGQYYQNDKTIKGNTQQRMSLASNVNLKLHKRVKLGIDLSASYNNNDLFALGREYYELLPIFSPYNADGTYRLYNMVVDGLNADGTPRFVKQRFLSNSVPEREQNDNNQKSWYVHTNFNLKYDIIDGLTYTGQFAYDYTSTLEQTYSSQKNWTGMSSTGEAIGYSRRSSADITNWTTVHRLNFNRTFGKHTVSAIAGFEAGSRDYTTMYVTGSGFINDNIRDVSQANTRDGYNSSSRRRKVSVLGQATYSFDHRYYLTVNGRKDGNSQFGSDVRWANFASIGASWNIHNEKFFHIPWINVLKLKGSYGANGNSRIGSLQSLGTYTYSDSNSYNGELGGVQGQSPNSRLSWETTYMTNLGLRVAALNRIDFEIEYYHNRTKNLLSQLPVSLLTASTRVYRNVGEIVNKGFEINLTTRNFVANREDGFSWTTDFNLAHNENRLTKSYRGTQVNFTDGISWIEGQDTKTYYLVRWAGVDPYDGSPMWYDANGNITKTYDSVNNRVRGKSANSTVTGGMTNTLSYKGFSLRFLLNYQFGGYAYSTFASIMNSDGYNVLSYNQAIEQQNFWRNPGDIARNPLPQAGVSTGSSRSSTRFLYRKDLVRLQNVVLTYQLPRALVSGWGLSNASVSLIGDNLMAYSPYSGSDHNSYKTVMSGYPLERTFTLSLNVGF
ncbi:MAG: SusC/RagA family TonB-linked outer membrane protein [Prevotella sp.]|nr:SusC/RagA family TonB-linked outer membrane protein [Prevotella sp.]MDD7605416.1 SusC/RagA family TonB-linked outer membrane protein [Prevotellaceae bacterium]MDY3248114.1 SusC/RagA family TonB-linked outer membrane protein [Prevotella sp.]